MTTPHSKKTIGRLPLRLALLLIPLVFACFALLPVAKAVNPPPGGGYPNGNTAEGQNALFSLTSGGYNTAVGFFSLRADNTGSFNTATGAGTLLFNTGNNNTATGALALLSNTTGYENIANGAFALQRNSTGNDNAAVGHVALFSNTTGYWNSAYGAYALYSNTGGIGSTATGYAALYNNTANYNTATGYAALDSNTTGSGNTAMGATALYSNVIGNYNTAIGVAALFTNYDAPYNTAVGYQALSASISQSNTAVGYQALSSTHGVNNIALGAFAGANLTGNGRDNIHIGHAGFADDNQVIRIGSGGHVGTFIDGIYGSNPADSVAVHVNSSGQLGTNTSSRRFKKEIKPMDQASEAILALNPVTFQYKADNTNTPQFGLIAEEVAKVNPALVVPDKEGKPYTVRYDQINAMLLNEFLKEHCEVAELKSIVTEQRKSMETMAAQLKEQAAQIQKVSGQLEASKPAPQVVNNP